MTDTPQHQTLTIHVPLKLTVRGGRKTIVAATSDSPAPSYRRDESTICALAKAFRWRALIESGHYSSITELAKDKKINESYACRLLRMTLLAPDIVRNVLDGRKDAPLLKDLMQPVSTNWTEQKLAFSQDR